MIRIISPPKSNQLILVARHIPPLQEFIRIHQQTYKGKNITSLIALQHCEKLYNYVHAFIYNTICRMWRADWYLHHINISR